jgi:signal transduction histidine kinase
MVEKDVRILGVAEELEAELAKRKGYLSYFFIDGDPHWLDNLAERRQAFSDILSEARRLAGPGVEKEILDSIVEENSRYIESKDRVIELYQTGRREDGAALHRELRTQFLRILRLSADFKKDRKHAIRERLEEERSRASRHRLIAGTSMSISLVLASLLAFVLVSQILNPIRKLAAADEAESADTGNEVAQLSSRVHGLLSDVDSTRDELERSRAQLVQSEKMAVMGKLAADMAHSIRNPMTSIKMRLFSLQRNLELPDAQKDDLEVVAEEMRRLDNIVGNFLEFSRPPKLQLRQVNVSEIVDTTLQLLDRRLERGGIQVQRRRRDDLPAIQADPELLKEVMVNLVVNACEAMVDGGKLVITEEEATAESMGRAVMVRFADTGPGFPEEVLDKVMDPFFSTKEDGTGLGLSIANRIIEEHGGRLDIRPDEVGGATITITVPAEEDET